MIDTKKDIETIREVGRASVEAMLMAKELVKPGVKLLDVANAAENFLREKGFGLAFPINISRNEQAAHYTPALDDDKVFTDRDLVKIDFGAEKKGILGDGAVTVDLSNSNHELIEVASEALENAISVVRAGVSVNKIGRVINETVEKRGFKVVKNLSGHGVDEHDLHAGMTIPNFDDGDETELEEGTLIAIEPFVTTGRGLVADSDIIEIYSHVGNEATRSNDARMLLKEIETHYKTEPFAVRWLSNVIGSKFKLYAAIGELMRAGAIEPHPTLVEISGAPVSQAEAELIVNSDSCDVITKVAIS